MLRGGKGATLSIDEQIRTPTPANIIALRLCASDILVAYELSGRALGTSLLETIARAIVAVPRLPSSARSSSAVDRATLALLERHGVSGFTRGGDSREPKVPAADPMLLIEWAAKSRALAVPKMRSFERSIIAARRAELFEGVALALLQLDAALASAGLRWLAMLPYDASDSVLISAGIHRAGLLGVDDPQTCFDCCLAMKVHWSRKR